METLCGHSLCAAVRRIGDPRRSTNRPGRADSGTGALVELLDLTSQNFAYPFSTGACHYLEGATFGMGALYKFHWADGTYRQVVIGGRFNCKPSSILASLPMEQTVVGNS